MLLPAKAQSYIAIFEDALEQLAVLEDITPESMKTDNKQVAVLNAASRKDYKDIGGTTRIAGTTSTIADWKR